MNRTTAKKLTRQALTVAAPRNLVSEMVDDITTAIEDAIEDFQDRYLTPGGGAKKKGVDTFTIDEAIENALSKIEKDLRAGKIRP